MAGEISDLLGRMVQLLETAEIPFMIAGSFASTTHGLPRTTQDLDLVIDPLTPAALEAFLSQTSTAQYYIDPDVARDAFKRRAMFNLIIATIGGALDRAYIERWVRDLDLTKDWAAAMATEV